MTHRSKLPKPPISSKPPVVKAPVIYPPTIPQPPIISKPQQSPPPTTSPIIAPLIQRTESAGQTTARVAVLLIGNMRSFTVTYRALEACLLRPYNCDLYITTYNKRYNMKWGMAEEMMTDANIRSVYGNYVKHLTIVDQDSFIEPYMRIKGKPYHFERDLDRLYTIQKLAMLAYDIFRGECVRNSRTYDFVVKMRPDIILNEKLNINPSLTQKQIVVPMNDSGGGFNDHMALGRPQVMTRYLTYYRTFHEIDNMDGGKNCDVSFIETGVKRNLEVVGIEIVRDPIKYMILRDNKPQKVVFAGKGHYFVKKY